MILLLVSFSVSLVFFALYQALTQIFEEAKKINFAKPALTVSECRLEAANLEIHKQSRIPVLIRVYLVGIFETIYIALCKRNLFKESSVSTTPTRPINDVIQSYTANPGLAVVTGGDSGIGYEVCKGLLKAGFCVIIGVRSVDDSRHAVITLQKATGSDKVSSIPLDLTSFESVKSFVEQVKRSTPNKDIQLLINNAGVMNIPCQITKDGFESQCQTNYLSPMLLTCSLLPWVKEMTGRVLFASSSTLYAINNLATDVSSKQYSSNGLDHYAYSKSCVAQLVARLAKTTRVKIYAYHPGTVRTKLFAHTTVFNIPLLSKLFNFIMLTPEEGSETPLYLCLSQDIGPSGSFCANQRIQTVPDICINGKENNIEALWNDTMIKCGLMATE